MTLAGIIKIILILLLTAGGLYQLFSLFCVIEFFGKKRNNAAYPRTPVSIIKPMKGTEPGLSENLRTFCRQDYPQYEVLLGFREPTDDAIPIAQKITLQEGCDIRVVISAKDLGANLKVSNLQGLFEAAKYPMLAISDSDMRVNDSYLRNIMGEYHGEKDVGLVTSLYKISDPRSIGTALESLTIALDFIPSVLVARRLEGVTFGLGASMLLSKKAIEEIGGFQAIADYLADDYQIGNRLWQKGYKIVLSAHVIEDIVGRMNTADYLTHQLRWARTYRASRPKGFAGSGITHIFTFAIFLFLLVPAPSTLSVLGAVIVLRLSMAYCMYRLVIRTEKWLKWLALLPVKDILSPVIWVLSFMSCNVCWRGRYYRILKGGTVKEED